MSLGTSAILEGNVMRVASRTIKRKADGAEFVINTFVLFGQHCQAEVRVNTDSGQKMPEVGKPVRCRVDISVYRDDDEISLGEYL